MSKRTKIGHRIRRRLGWLAYGLSPRWLAAIMATFYILGEATEASERQAGQ